MFVDVLVTVVIICYRFVISFVSWEFVIYCQVVMILLKVKQYWFVNVKVIVYVECNHCHSLEFLSVNYYCVRILMS